MFDTLRVVTILGIETSCDETAAAVVENGNRLLSNVVASSMDLHAAYGGVVPEIAARSHIESILPVVDQALADAFGKKKSADRGYWNQIDAIAVTYGAGLAGSLLIGVLTARTLALAYKKPLYAANHVMGHVYANFITTASTQSYILPAEPPEFPMLAIIVSGGHSQLALFRNHFDYVLLGRTHDDAIGEAFDKVAKILGLPYPGGPSVSQAAAQGDPNAFDFPKAKLANPYDFSFSGLKTAVLRCAQHAAGKDYTFPSHELPGRLNEAQKADIAAGFQRVAIETVAEKAERACREFNPRSVVVAGGVAANTELRRQLRERLPLPVRFPDIKLCTDNGAMIAALGCYQMSTGQPTADPSSLDISPNLSM